LQEIIINHLAIQDNTKPKTRSKTPLICAVRRFTTSRAN